MATKLISMNVANEWLNVNGVLMIGVEFTFGVSFDKANVSACVVWHQPRNIVYQHIQSLGHKERNISISAILVYVEH